MEEIWIELTAAEQNIGLGPTVIDRATSVELISFDAYGVPLVGTEPYVTDFVVRVEEMQGPARFSSNSGPTRGVNLPLDGAVTRHEYTHPALVGCHTGGGRTDFTFRVSDATGRAAVFTRLVLRLRVYGNMAGQTDPMDISDPYVRAHRAQGANRVRLFH